MEGSRGRPAHAKMLANTGLRRCRAAAGAALHIVPRAPRPAPILL